MEIRRAVEIISARYKNLGYIVPKIIYKIVNTFDKRDGVGDFNPIASSKTGNIIYIDKHAYGDIAGSPETMFFYLAHEIAHIITNSDHGNKKFETAIIKYNAAYPKQKTSAKVDDSFNRKYVPEFYRIDKYLDDHKDISIEQAERIISGTSAVNESILNY